MTSSSIKTLGYIPALDGLRAVGILFVLITHAAKPFVYPGGFGVDVFFVLSGFLITTLLLIESESTGRVALVPFYLKRAIRLYPSLLTVIVVTIVVGLSLGSDIGRLLIDSSAAALYLTPFSSAFVGEPEYYGHLWTLAVEEFFT